jgi:RNA polymerase sigma factor (TIGR02999 family)
VLRSARSFTRGHGVRHSPQKPLSHQAEGRAAVDELLPLVYDQLRLLARAYLRRERTGHTLQPTALVHEAYLRLVEQRTIRCENRAHFLALAATMMRRILVNHAQARRAAKRGGGLSTVALDSACFSPPGGRQIDVLLLNDALEKLAAVDAMKARVVELRFFGGLSVDEVSEIVGRSRASVERDWTFARAWLYTHLKD